MMTMETTSYPKSRRYWTSNMVAERYSVTTRTLHSWMKDGRLAQPVKLPNGRKIILGRGACDDNAWTDEVIEALDATINQDAED